MGVWFLAMVGLAAVMLGVALKADGTLTDAMAIHAALMITAWGVLLPAGGVVARYFKVTPRQKFPEEIDNLFWFNWHRVLQYAGVAVATVSVGIIGFETGGRVATWHGRLGLVTMGLAWLQIASTWFRGEKGGPTGKGAVADEPATWRGDHYDMTTRRLLFEAWHKRAGWAAIVLAGITILLGVQLAGAPTWLVCVVAGVQAAAILGVLDGRLQGRWIDTYQAIWGPDPRHPGNSRFSAPPFRPRRGRSRR